MSSCAAAVAATACCDSSGSCYTKSGTTAGGLNWCYGFQNGQKPWTAGDNGAAKCLVNLHLNQNSACITTAGSSCDDAGNSPEVLCAHSTELFGGYQLDSDDASAIQAAMDDAFASGLMWSDSTAQGPGYVVFTHVADNGSGVKGIQIFNNNLC
ncbi:hypothetical protein LTR78_010644 [Recurvomyces mirabilis]|uniref:Uncharacterized protein n=1 Tax=Recurvomyces mirabilis TaxID=574656 RepID=A0AAE0TMA8_9PEZI|nr:hypothetical protein LTR78_010644 [Recurvomyces mirabilis]